MRHLHLLILALTISASYSATTVVIDDFSAGTGATRNDPTKTRVQTETGLSTNVVMGGRRTITVDGLLSATVTGGSVTLATPSPSASMNFGYSTRTANFNLGVDLVEIRITTGSFSGSAQGIAWVGDSTGKRSWATFTASGSSVVTNLAADFQGFAALTNITDCWIELRPTNSVILADISATVN